MSADPEEPVLTETSSPSQVTPVVESTPSHPPVVDGGLGLWVRDLLISAAVSILIILFLYQPVRVEGTSMLPRLEDHDRLFINKFVYHITSIERGDVVVFHYPRNPEEATSSVSSPCPATHSALIVARFGSTGKPSPRATSLKCTAIRALTAKP